MPQISPVEYIAARIQLGFAPGAADDPPTGDEVVKTVIDDVTSAHWWMGTAVPHLIRIVLIVVVLITLRWLILSALRRGALKVADSATDVPATSGADLILAERKAQRAHTLSSLFRNIVNIVIISMMVLLVMAQLGFNLGPLVAGAGILGVALGFGAQSLVADFLSGIFMLMEDQYGVGDVVDVGDATGTVEEVQLRITKLRSVDGVLWFVRNGEIVRVGNHSQDWSRSLLDIGIAYDADVPKAKAIMARVGEEVARDPEYAESFLEVPEVWGVELLGNDSVVLRMVSKTHPGTQWVTSRALREKIKEAFDANGIEIPFPQRTVWIRHESDERADHPRSGSAAVPADGELDLTERGTEPAGAKVDETGAEVDEHAAVDEVGAQ